MEFHKHQNTPLLDKRQGQLAEENDPVCQAREGWGVCMCVMGGVCDGWGG